MDGNSSSALLIVCFFYFMPFILAVCRDSAYTTRCFWVNLLLGWTFIGWLAAWIFAAAPKAREMSYRKRVKLARDEFYLREQEKARL